MITKGSLKQKDEDNSIILQMTIDMIRVMIRTMRMMMIMML